MLQLFSRTPYAPVTSTEPLVERNLKMAAPIWRRNDITLISARRRQPCNRSWGSFWTWMFEELRKDNEHFSICICEQCSSRHYCAILSQIDLTFWTSQIPQIWFKSWDIKPTPNLWDDLSKGISVLSGFDGCDKLARSRRSDQLALECQQEPKDE